MSLASLNLKDRTQELVHKLPVAELNVLSDNDVCSIVRMIFMSRGFPLSPAMPQDSSLSE